MADMELYKLRLEPGVLDAIAEVAEVETEGRVSTAARKLIKEALDARGVPWKPIAGQGKGRGAVRERERPSGPIPASPRSPRAPKGPPAADDGSSGRSDPLDDIC